MKTIELVRHPYRYFPYELELAKREVRALFNPNSISETDRGLLLQGPIDPDLADRLVYFARASQGDHILHTLQSRLERANGNGPNRQSTRYSSHGLHEYKGKFNPQIARAILNFLNIPIGAKVIDPFCGSGTTLLECDHLGIHAIGLDINPLAVFIANAKLEAVRIPVSRLNQILGAVLKRYRKINLPLQSQNSHRQEYLLSWFDEGIYREIEKIRLSIEMEAESATSPLLAIASNLLRDYSQQDPKDLRIRRRKTPLPEIPFLQAFEEAARFFINKLEDAQRIIRFSSNSRALQLDSRELKADQPNMTEKFDCALTSPPYATALPYIDTQRLSLVWLGLIPPSEILPLEAKLIGSREIRGGQSKTCLLASLENNHDRIPDAQANYCLFLQNALGPNDGFRRKALPVLLYRYFSSMNQVFRALKPFMNKNAPFALIVGGNHTVLGGQRYEINTPHHLAEIAESCGWTHLETIPLQTYQRYGYHVDNAVTSESIVILRAT